MNRIKYLIILQFLNTLYCQPGNLISYEHKISASSSDMQWLVDLALGNNAPEALYDMSMYSIEYEIIDPQGYVDTLSGLVSFPIDPRKIFPIANCTSYMHSNRRTKKKI